MDMKKKIALIMSIVMCGSMFTACGSDDDDSSSSKSASTSVSSTEAASDEDDTTEASDEETTEEKTTEDSIAVPTSDDDVKEEPTEDSHNAAKGTNFKRGSVENGVYSNEYAGIKFKTPDGWTELSEEQLLSMMNLGLELTGNEDMINDELMKQTAIYDYSAKSANGDNVAVMFENLKVSSGSLADSITEEVYLKSIQSQLKSVSGVTYNDLTEPKEIELCGNKYYKISHKATYDSMGGYTVSQNYYVRRLDDFMVLILLTSGVGGESMDTFEQNFVD